MPLLNDVPHLKTVRKKIYLEDKYITTYYLMTTTFNDMYESIINKQNVINRNRAVKNLYIPALYKGRIMSSNYKANHQKDRLSEYRTMLTKGIRGIGKLPVESSYFYGMHYHIDLLQEALSKLTISMNRRVVLFWQYYSNIFNTASLGGIDHKKIVLYNMNYTKPINKDNKINISEVNHIFYIWYTIKTKPELILNLDIDFYFYTDKAILYMNPSKLSGRADAQKFLRQLELLTANLVTDLDIEDVDKTDKIETIMDKSSPMKNIVATSEVEKIIDDEDEKTITADASIPEEEIDQTFNPIDDMIREKLKDVFDEDPHVDIKEAVVRARKLIDESKDDLKKIYTTLQSQKVPSAPVLSARDKLLKEEQQKIVVKGIKLKDLEERDAIKMTIPKTNIKNQLFTANDALDELTFVNFDKEYIEKILPKDIMDCFLALNNKTIPMHIRDVKVEDSSNELNYKETWTVSLEDINRKRHTLTIDIPKIIDNKFLFLGGNEKNIINQKFYLPIVKTKSNEVQITTNYNKNFLFREGPEYTTISNLMNVIKKNPSLSKYFKFGNAFGSNSDYITTIEYDQLSKIMTKFKSNNVVIYFKQESLHEAIKDKGFKDKKNYIMIGISNNKPIYINTDTQMDDDNKTIIDIIYESLPDSDKEFFKRTSSTNTPKRTLRATIRVMEKKIPVSILVAYYEGFSKLLTLSGIDYRLEPVGNKSVKIDYNEIVIPFKNVYFIYKGLPYPMMLMSGFSMINTKEYDIGDMDTVEPYLDYLIKVYGSMNSLNSLMNAYEWTIDPITKEILQDCGYPDTYSELLLYGVKLLLDDQYQADMQQRISRIRRMEVIPATLYWSLARNYVNFRNSAGRKKYTVPKDSVIKTILGIQTVEDTSILNPVLELERLYSTSQKGFRGVNLQEHYTMDKRAYDPSMTGIFGLSSSPDAQVGVTVSMSLEPTITNLRGYADIKGDTDKIDELKNVNLLSPGELLIPMAGSHDDSTRLGHAIKQSKHCVPIKGGSPALITNGVDEICRYYLSSNYIINADDDGEVIEYDEKAKLIIVEYKNGTYRAINLDSVIVKNGGGGFSMTNILTSDLKLGSKFKKGDCLAWHKDYFRKSPITGTVRYDIGRLTKIALMSTYNTFQDSTLIDEDTSNDMTTEMTFPFSVVVGKNSNVEFIAKEGDHIEVGQSLIRFDTSFENAEVNKLLASLSKDERLKDDIMEDSRNDIKSKYAGVIEKIEVYAAIDLEEMSDSLRNIVNSHYNKIKRKKKLLEKYDKNQGIVKCGLMITDPTEKIELGRYGVIKGNAALDSVVFIFNIRHDEVLETASKIANYSGLKNTIGEIIPNDLAGWSSFRPDENIGSIIASNSILKRKTPSIILLTAANKACVEWKRAIIDIWKS